MADLAPVNPILADLTREHALKRHWMAQGLSVRPATLLGVKNIATHDELVAALGRSIIRDGKFRMREPNIGRKAVAELAQAARQHALSDQCSVDSILTAAVLQWTERKPKTRSG